jgi:hypothetical protein
MFVRRRVAAPHMPTLHAHPQMHPCPTDLQTVLTAVSRRLHLPNLVQMGTFHGSTFPLLDSILTSADPATKTASQSRWGGTPVQPIYSGNDSIASPGFSAFNSTSSGTHPMLPIEGEDAARFASMKLRILSVDHERWIPLQNRWRPRLPQPVLKTAEPAPNQPKRLGGMVNIRNARLVSLCRISSRRYPLRSPGQATSKS